MIEIIEFNKIATNVKAYFFKKFKRYSVEEIVASDGTTAFAKLTGYDPKVYII